MTTDLDTAVRCAALARRFLLIAFLLSIIGCLICHFRLHNGTAETSCGVVGVLAGVELKRRG